MIAGPGWRSPVNSYNRPYQRFVLDTSLFLTEEIRRDGASLAETLGRLLDLLAAAHLELDRTRR